MRQFTQLNSQAQDSQRSDGKVAEPLREIMVRKTELAYRSSQKLLTGQFFIKQTLLRLALIFQGIDSCRPFESATCGVKHQVKDRIALFFEQDAVVAVGKMFVQNFLNYGLNPVFGL